MKDDTRIVMKGSSGDFKVNKDTHMIVHCSDGKYVEIRKDHAKQCSFIKSASASGDMPEFEFPSTVLGNLVSWALKYGITGQCDSPLTRPCIYRDFSYVVKNSWDDEFFRVRLLSMVNQRYFINTMVAADKFGMTGLLDFMSVCLGCKLRNEDDETIMHDIMCLERENPVTSEDLDKVQQQCSWVKEATRPTTMK